MPRVDADLPPLPAGFSATRESLHRLAEDVIKPAREQTSGEWTLVAAPGGFGTPVFGEGEQVRVEGAELVVLEGGSERRAPIGSLAEAADLIGTRLLPQPLTGLGEGRLAIDPLACEALAAAYAVGQAALERLREAAGSADAPTEPTLWPEHFDLAIEMGDEDAGRRANYGLSPGDGDHAQPYFYVGPWSAPATGELWNARGFEGAELGYDELQASSDPVGLALEFSLARKRALEKERDT
jgi:hypothetical protein